MMAVARGDLRARLTTAKGVAVLAVWLAVLHLLALFGTAPDGSADQPALGVASWIFLAAVSFLCVAVTSGEVAIPGEKGLPDLATAFFPAREIARGKALAGFLYALLLSFLALPALAFLAGLRALPWTAAAGQVVAAVPVGWAFAGIGTWLGGVVENDLLRSLAVWTVVGGVLGSLFLWASPSSLQAVHPSAPGTVRLLWVGEWTVVGTAVFWLCARQVERLRRSP
ncbi:MAG: hypothetical protein QN193_00345 [Armatimonadota bacterium]|nr:hypothetical protein [Armatimonadota bacterium]MDR7443791.1 hypothetical protein [Armatimonadota bacterium]MDR7569040.1 hypothetical protein [Armatimonadota bacterium]MDR7613929.1 hypothetical protein [Armatimonadota bacterium]